MEAFQAKLVQTLVSTQLIKSVGQSFELWGFFRCFHCSLKNISIDYL